MCYLQPMHHSMPGANHHHIHTQLFSRIVCHIIIWWYIGAILAAPHRGAKGCHPPCRRWSIDVLFSTHASQFSVNSFKPSQRPWDVSGQLEFVCPRHPQRHKFRMLDKGLTFILLAYWEGAVLSSLYIGRTSPASPCRLNLFLSPRKSHTIGGPSTIHWPVDCYPICRCPIPPPNPPPSTAYMLDLTGAKGKELEGAPHRTRLWKRPSVKWISVDWDVWSVSQLILDIFCNLYQEVFLQHAREAKVHTQSNSNQRHAAPLFELRKEVLFQSVVVKRCSSERWTGRVNCPAR